MSSTKKGPATNGRKFLTELPRLYQRSNPRLILFVALVAVLAASLTYAWRHWGTAVTQHKRYLLSLDSLQVPVQPEFIRADVKAEVFRDGSLGTFSILDPQVTLKVARAFTGHSWVARVRRVAKQYPDRVLVELEYRQPVGMVAVTDNHGQPGVIPVDANGVVLPTSDFGPTAASGDSPAKNYLRIVVGDTVPAGIEGTPWGDERVHGAAQVADLLAKHWRSLGLFRISLAETDLPSKKRSEIMYELVSREGTRVLWGHAPGSERPSETTAAEKLARLTLFVERNGSLAGKESPESIDVRARSGISVSPRTARR